MGFCRLIYNENIFVHFPKQRWPTFLPLGSSSMVQKAELSPFRACNWRYWVHVVEQPVKKHALLFLEVGGIWAKVNRNLVLSCFSLLLNISDINVFKNLTSLSFINHLIHNLIFEETWSNVKSFLIDYSCI